MAIGNSNLHLSLAGPGFVNSRLMMLIQLDEDQGTQALTRDEVEEVCVELEVLAKAWRAELAKRGPSNDD